MGADIIRGEITRYFDKNGNELLEGDTIIYDDGRREKLYRTVDGKLGTDATNPVWIEKGRAVPCEYGIYPLEWAEMSHILKLKEGKKMGKDLERCDWVILVRNFADGDGAGFYKLENKTADEVKETIIADAKKWSEDDDCEVFTDWTEGESTAKTSIVVEKLDRFGWWCGVGDGCTMDYQIEARPYKWLFEYTI